MQNKLVIHSYIHSRTVPYIANMVSDSSYLTCWEYNNKKDIVMCLWKLQWKVIRLL